MYDKIICLGYFPVPHNRIEGRQKWYSMLNINFGKMISSLVQQHYCLLNGPPKSGSGVWGLNELQVSIDNLLPCDRQAGQFQRYSVQSTKYSAAAVEKIGIYCTENWSNSPFDYIFGVFLWPEYNIKHLLY